MFTIKIEDPELREALKEEARAALKSLGREEAARILQETIDKAVDVGSKRFAAQIGSYGGGPFGPKFGAGVQQAIVPVLIKAMEEKGIARANKYIDDHGGIEAMLSAVISKTFRSVIQEEIKKLKEAGEVFAALKGAIS